MRAGVLISAISHVVLVLLALLGTPKLFDGSQTPAITVELVGPEEIDAPRPEPEPAKEKPPLSGRSAEQQTAPQPAAEGDSRAARLDPQPSSSTPSIFDPASIPMLLDIPNAPEKGFDAEATTRAELSDGERVAFRARLLKCASLPGGASLNQATRVVLRIYLRRDARLAGEPVLIQGSASHDGVVLMQSAVRALKDCQPFTFLSPERYGEWKVLDLSFTPRDLGGR